MFAYLSKKLEMASGANIKCLSWSHTNNFLACGCDSGLLKVVKIDATKGSEGKDESGKSTAFPIGYLASPTNILVNQTLEGHSSPIQVLAWNNVHNKLTSSDNRGQIIVWMLFKGNWYEEMVNNRNKSTVRGLDWSSDGEKICIVYEDGGIIVGTSDGNRLWSKDLKGPKLCGVKWSPDATHLLFTLQNGEVHIYNSEGNYTSKLAVDATNVPHSGEESEPIAAVRWHHGGPTPGAYRLAVVFKSSYVYFFKNSADRKPYSFPTNLKNSCAEWSPNGLFFSIGGSPMDKALNKCDQVRVYNAAGNFLFELNLPFYGIVDLAWDSWSLRLAIGVGANIFFANIRPFYKVCNFGGHMYIFSYSKPDGSTQLGFWDLEKVNTQEILGRVIDLKGNSEIAAILSYHNEFYTIAVANSIGNALDNITLNVIAPFALVATESFIIALARNSAFIWRYYKENSRTELGSQLHKQREKVFHIDDKTTNYTSDLEQSKLKARMEEPSPDPVVCGDGKDHILVIGRKSGSIHAYTLPKAALLCVISATAELTITPRRIFLNCDASQVAMIDQSGSLTICSLSARVQVQGTAKKFDKKDIWDLIWAKDNPNLLCIMEKTRLYIISNGVLQEPVLSSGYLMNFVNLEVTTILMDELMHDPESPKPQLIVKYETRSLRDARALIQSNSPLESVTQYIEENSHPALWQMLGKKALYNLNFKTAETAFVRCKDYAGIQFTKRISLIPNEAVQLGEICSFYKDFQDAERYYIKAGRRDLVINMRAALGRWKDVDIDQIFSRTSTKGAVDLSIEIGDYFSQLGKWNEAKPYYQRSGDLSKIFNCCLMLEDFEGLGEVTKKLPKGSPFYEKIGDVMCAVGLCDLAVEAYAGGELFQQAVECCIQLSRWSLAMELTQKHNLPSRAKVLVKYAVHLIRQDELINAIDLFKISKQPLYGAKLATMLALNLMEPVEFDPILVRKLFDLAVCLAEMPEAKNNDNEMIYGAYGLENLFQQYMPEELVPNLEINEWIEHQPRRGFTAIDILIKVQRDLYGRDYMSAAKRSVTLMDYTDILGEERVGAIVALASANIEAFQQTSQALMLLEGRDPKYWDISYQLFWEVEPVNLVNPGMQSHRPTPTVTLLSDSD